MADDDFGRFVSDTVAEIQRLTSTLVSPAGTSTEEALQREMASLKESIHTMQEKNSQLQNEVSKLQLKLRLSTSQPAAGEGVGTEEVGAVAVSSAEAKAETFKPPKDIMPETDMEWKGVVRHEESKKAGAFTSLFNGIDKNGDGTISGKELEDSLHEIPVLVLAESVKLRDLRERLKSPGETVSFEEFELVAKDLFRCRYSSICSSAQFGETLTDLLMNALMEASGEVWKEEADALHPLKSLAALSDEKCRALVLEKCESALPTVVKRLVLMMKAEGQYSAEQKALADPDGKFDGQLVLCPPRTFSVGLEVMIGYPAIASDEAVLKKMMEEHCNGDLATKEFDAYNAGKKRTTTSKEQFEKLLPGGIEHNISTCDYEGKKMLQDGELFEKHEKTRKAGLKKYEVLALRLYTGPLYAAYNCGLRALGAAVDKKLPEVQEENFASGDETAQMDEAIKRAREEVGEFQFVTTLHALNGALIKLGAITSLPPGGKVFRGVAGIQAPEKFLHPNEYGCRVGTECGLMSMTIDKNVAIGYMGAKKRHKQMFEAEVDQINRGADLDWLSVFPGEKEMLFPPNSCLEVKGGSRYEFSDKGLILLWMLRVSINLKGKTIEDFQAMRQSLLVPMANNGLREVSQFLASTGRIEAPPDSPSRRLPDTILKQCTETVTGLKDKRAEDFNEDAIYSSSVQDVLMLVPWAKALTALESAMPDEKELGLLEIKDFLPSAKTGGDDGVVAAKTAAAIGLCRRKGLFTVHLEDQDEQGRTALHRCAEENKLQEVELLIACGARIEALDLRKRTPLHLAIQGGGADGDTLPERTGHTASKLVDLKADVNAADVQGTSVLMYAIEAKLEALCDKLIEMGADINAKTDEGKTVLMYAIEAKMEALYDKLIDKGADNNASDQAGETVLMYAIKAKLEALCIKMVEKGADNGEPVLVLRYAIEAKLEALCDKLIEKGADINAESGDKPVLIYAVEAQLEALCIKMVEKGADVNCKYGRYWATSRWQDKTVFMYAIEAKMEAFCDKLFDKGADINASDCWDEKPVLIHLVEAKLEALCIKMVEKGADVNCEFWSGNRDGKTVLMYAIKAKMEALCDKLIDKGAGINAKDRGGKTVLMFAIEAKMAALCDKLIDKGAGINASDGNTGKTVLMYAIEAKMEALCDKLIDKGVNVNGEEYAECCGEPTNGKSVLMYAIKAKMEALCDKLIEKGANINAKCPLEDDGKTVLMFAIEAKMEALCDKLIDKGAGINAKDPNAETVLMYAIKAKMEALCDKLIKKGANINAKSDKHVLIYAVEAKLEALCMKMVEKGADVNCKFHGPVIMCAIDNELQELAEKLIEKGADVQAKDRNGKGVLDYANEKNFTALADKIKRKIENAEG